MNCIYALNCISCLQISGISQAGLNKARHYVSGHLKNASVDEVTKTNVQTFFNHVELTARTMTALFKSRRLGTT